MSNIFADLQAESERQKQAISQEPITITPKHTKATVVPVQSTRKITPQSTLKAASVRDRSSANPREKSRDLPSRNEIQEFSFSLRDELKVKMQAEVPHQWQSELEAIARELNVKKLELYRFIVGQFLGKVRHQRRKEHDL